MYRLAWRLEAGNNIIGISLFCYDTIEVMVSGVHVWYMQNNSALNAPICRVFVLISCLWGAVQYRQHVSLHVQTK